MQEAKAQNGLWNQLKKNKNKKNGNSDFEKETRSLKLHFCYVSILTLLPICIQQLEKICLPERDTENTYACALTCTAQWAKPAKQYS
jgi:hypothetical protein